MPTQRLSKRRIKQLLAMRFGAGASTREIARELGVAPSTVREYLGRVAAAGLTGRWRREAACQLTAPLWQKQTLGD